MWLVASQIDAKGQAISYQYDALDRLTSKSGPSLGTVLYTYDIGGTNGIGRRTALSVQQGTTSFPYNYAYDYDQRGRLTSLSCGMAGTAYQFAMTYDAQDRPLSLTYPALDGSPTGDVLSYAYGDHGKPISVLLNGAPLVLNASYNALLKPTVLPLGNGLQTLWKYYGSNLDVVYNQNDPNKWYGLPYQVQTGNLQNQSFPVSPPGYDNVGNPTGIAFADHTNETLAFSYNELDQLLAMSGRQARQNVAKAERYNELDQLLAMSGSVSEGFGTYLQTIQVPPYSSYDVGNLLQLGSASLSYGLAQPHAPSWAGSVNYTYDANGNRHTDSAGNSYTYDAENRLTSVTGQVSLQNAYDAAGVRLSRNANGTTTVYVGDWFEVTGGVATAYYPFNEQPIACLQGSSLFCWLATAHDMDVAADDRP